MTQPPPLQTLAASHEAASETIKGARFVGRAVPLEIHAASRDVTDAVAVARSDHASAVHHGWAYRIGPEPADFGWSDDGEPVGSAGASILRRIDAANLLNVIVIVSRWGGSQRLSAGDLAKGYSAAAREVLATAKVTTFVPTTLIVVTFDYAESGPVQGVLASFRAGHEDADYGTCVRLVVRVESRFVEALFAAVRDATSGRAQVEVYQQA